MNRSEISIQDIFQAILSHLVVIALVGLLGGAVSWAYTRYHIKPLYRTSVTLYASSNVNRDSDSITVSEQDSSRRLATTYSVILKSNTVMSQVSDKLKAAGVNYSASQLQAMLSVSTTGTEVFNAVVSTTDRTNAKLIADTIANVGAVKITEIVGSGEVRVVDYAQVPAGSYYPNVQGNVIIGVLVGLLLSAMIVVIRQLTDTTIWNEEDITKQYNIPVLGTIPQLSGSERQNSGKE